MKTLWTKISALGVEPKMPIETARKIILTNQLAILSFILFTLMNVLFTFILDSYEVTSFLSVSTILIALYLNKKGYYKLTSFFISASTPLAILFFSAYSKTQAALPLDINLYIFPKMLMLGSLVLPLILIDRKQKLLLIIAVSINVISIFAIDYVHNLLHVFMRPEIITYSYFHPSIILFLVPVLIIVLGFIFLNTINDKYETKILNLLSEVNQKNDLLTEQNEEIKAQRDEIEEKSQKLELLNTKIHKINLDLTDSIHYAERIQNATLPDTNILKRFFPDSFIYYKPKSIVSGDFYFFKESKVGQNNCLVIVAADCTGHGVPGGFMSMLGMTFLNEIVQKGKFFDAADILNQLRDNIKEALKQKGNISDQKDGMDLALCIYYPGLKKLDFSGAKNPLYIFRNSNEATIYKADRMPIGIYIKENPFTNTTINLKGGETCYIFSDGVVDQMNYEGKKFMTKNFRNYLGEINNYPCTEQYQLFHQKMQNWMTYHSEITEQTDDMLLLGFKI